MLVQPDYAFPLRVTLAQGFRHLSRAWVVIKKVNAGHAIENDTPARVIVKIDVEFAIIFALPNIVVAFRVVDKISVIFPFCKRACMEQKFSINNEEQPNISISRIILFRYDCSPPVPVSIPQNRILPANDALLRGDVLKQNYIWVPIPAW